ncbi:hypothetical protein Bbelb_283550 [Branchiostoma belcheri]|nr:hypothetical protein Bbelb_283550 [Branchiostoma belcheri]
MASSREENFCDAGRCGRRRGASVCWRLRADPAEHGEGVGVEKEFGAAAPAMGGWSRLRCVQNIVPLEKPYKQSTATTTTAHVGGGGMEKGTTKHSIGEGKGNQAKWDSVGRGEGAGTSGNSRRKGGCKSRNQSDAGRCGGRPIPASEESKDEVVNEEEDVVNVPNFRTVRTQLERRRAALAPPIPYDVADVEIPDQWRETWVGRQYLSHQDNVGGIVVKMRHCRVLYMDGTFKSCPWQVNSSSDLQHNAQANSSSDLQHNAQVNSSSDIQHNAQANSSSDLQHNAQVNSSSDIQHNEQVNSSSDLQHNAQVNSPSDIQHNEQVNSSSDIQHNAQANSSSDLQHNAQVNSSSDIQHNEQVNSSSDLQHNAQVNSPSDIQHNEQVNSSSDIQHNAQANSSSDLQHNAQVNSSSDIQHNEQVNSSSDIQHNAQANSSSDLQHNAAYCQPGDHDERCTLQSCILLDEWEQLLHSAEDYQRAILHVLELYPLKQYIQQYTLLFAAD